VGMNWQGGKLTGATPRSVGGTAARVRYGGKMQALTLKNGETLRLDAALTRTK
jgi:alpha-L-fucosidase 2